MRRFKLHYLFIPSFLALFSCNNEIDINANWKETIIVHGLLDPIDSVQYIRTEKAFLDEKTGALILAKNSDSFYLDSLSVILKPEGGADIILSRTNQVPKDSGLFANDKNYLWRTDIPISPDKSYGLEVVNLRTGKRVTAVTKTITPASISAPVKNPSSTFSIFPEYIAVEFTPKANSHTYDVKMDFTYDEFSLADTNNKVTKTARWHLLTNIVVTPLTLSTHRIPRKAFLEFLTSSIAADSTLLHRVKTVDFTFYGGNRTLADYISVNQPSIGIVQKTADYTNINGGYGIFASRCIQAIRGTKMDPTSIGILINNAETKKLNFIR